MSGSDSGSPIFTMRDWYKEHNEGGEAAFDEDLRAYLAFHYVYSGPDLFIMARLVPHWISDAQLHQPYYPMPQEECDSWYVHAAAGDLSVIWKLLQLYVPFAIWTNMGRRYTVDLTRAKEMLTRTNKTLIG